jgi:hypothetical protein
MGWPRILGGKEVTVLTAEVLDAGLPERREHPVSCGMAMLRGTLIVI